MTDMSDTAAAADTAGTTTTPARSGGKRQVKVGTVVSDAMNKTVVVAVPNPVAHRLYHRSIKRTSKFHAHDEKNECRVGDTVEIVSSRPLSRTKRWRVRDVLKRAE